jgi:hypothetical protein
MFQAICPALNEQLLNLANEHSPLLKQSQVGTLRAVYDQYNRANVRIVPIDQGNGQIKTIQVMYQQRGTTSDIQAGVPECITGPYTEPDNFAHNYTIDTGFNKQLKFVEKDIRELCEGRDSWITKQVAAQMDSIRQYINGQLITYMISQVGNYAGGTNSGTSPIALNLLEPIATGGITVGNYIGESTMLNALADASVLGLPIAIGNGDLRSYVNMQKIGCCNNGGIDMNLAGQFAYFMDDQLTTALANNNFYVLEAGALQFLPVNFNKGEYELLAPTESRSTIIDPVIPGLEYDFNFFKPPGCNYWIGQLSLNYTFGALYNDGYQAGDILDGVNGIFQFNAAT